jgi:hypothetical protein
MRRVLRELTFAFTSWLVPFVASVCVYPLRASRPYAFEAVLGIVLVGTAAALGALYLRPIASGFARRGLVAGLTWMAANWALDGLMFSHGPMAMSFKQYAAEIAPAYLQLPVVTCGLGMAMQAGFAKGRRGIISPASSAPPLQS